ncbi:hypothetical protein CgunFtcFv8_005656 [Champsocephalus gunnari]|uniref:Sodium-dependent lysophosphatidylcholine symporter 1 n=1 Tax=Champsocephalus gunnari TaxID=52237 RepID=A0AAN8CW01_CHAGU|nr:hypothetical protein CgunFtcFv8_005656 [Champsocephalus gunnari]
MAKGEGSEQYSNASLLNKPDNSDVIKLSSKKENRNRLSVCNKICYAVGGAPYQITGCALGFFLQIYLLDVAQLDPFQASIILFAGRAWDAVTDPTVGFLVSRSPWTRFGRMLPWILFSTPLAVISYFLIWYVPPFENGKVIWYLVFYCIFQSLQTCFHVPYSALTMFISSEQKERDSATAYRMTVEVLGTVVGTAIQGQIVGMANAPCLPGPGDILANLSNYSLLAGHNSSEPVISLDHTKTAYMISSGIISIIYVLCAIVLFCGVKEQKDSCRPRSEPMGFFQGIRLVMGHGPYVKLIMVFLFTSLAFMLLEGNFALFLQLHTGLQKRLPEYTAGHHAFRYSGHPILAVVPDPLWEKDGGLRWHLGCGPLHDPGGPFLLPWSMLPDVVDDFQVQNPDSTGHEALFYSFYVFFTKFASGVSLGVSTLSLDFAGYISRGCTQPEAVHVTLKVLVSAAPIVLILIGLTILYFYPITEEKRQGNRKLLQELRDNEADSETESTELANMI